MWTNDKALRNLIQCGALSLDVLFEDEYPYHPQETIESWIEQSDKYLRITTYEMLSYSKFDIRAYKALIKPALYYADEDKEVIESPFFLTQDEAEEFVAKHRAKNEIILDVDTLLNQLVSRVEFARLSKDKVYAMASEIALTPGDLCRIDVGDSLFYFTSPYERVEFVLYEMLRACRGVREYKLT